MTTTTAASDRRARRGGGRAGFSLVELMVALGISSVALTAIISSFLFLCRSCLTTQDYAGLDRESRIGLEVFARELRMASDVSNFSSSGVSLEVPTESGEYWVDYRFDPDTDTFYRAYGTPAQRALITGISAFELRRFTLQQQPASNDLETKQIQLELRAVRAGPLKALASDNVVSARYVLRNKVVSN